MNHFLQIDERMKLNLGPIKGESTPSFWFDKYYSTQQQIWQMQNQNILGPTVNAQLLEPYCENMFDTNQPIFDHASKICVLKQGVPNGLI